MKKNFVYLGLFLLLSGCSSISSVESSAALYTINSVVGIYESEYIDGVKPVLQLRADSSFDITINHCAWMCTSKGKYHLDGDTVVLENAINRDHVESPPLGKMTHDLVFFIESKNILRVKSGATWSNGTGQAVYGLCSPGNNEKFIRK